MMKFYDGVWRNEVLFGCVAGAGDTFFSKKMGDETFVIDNETFVIGYK